MTDEEAAALLAAAPLQSGEPPKDRVFYARQHVPMKWTPYKANSDQARRGIKGRWQTLRPYGLGWENAPEPPRAGAWIEDPLNPDPIICGVEDAA